MKIVIAPDSFKESMTSLEAARSIEKALKRFCLTPNTSIFRLPTEAKEPFRLWLTLPKEISYIKRSLALSGSP